MKKKKKKERKENFQPSFVFSQGEHLLCGWVVFSSPPPPTPPGQRDVCTGPNPVGAEPRVDAASPQPRAVVGTRAG